MASASPEVIYGWTPQVGPQLEAITATWCPELFFGGARGGGKTAYLLGDFLQDVQDYGPHWKGILFRKNYTELKEVRRQAAEIYPQTGAIWRAGEREWIWPNGATLLFRHIEGEHDLAKYQGHQYTWIGFDELTNWASPDTYLPLFACLRGAGAEIPTKRMRATGNPGGPGHIWVKERFVDPAPLGCQPIEDVESQSTRMFIRSLVTDNKILLDRDPDYIRRLKLVGSDELVRCWLEGDWTVIRGAYFSEFSDRHLCAPFPIPNHWLKYVGFDWGYASPFACTWYAISSGKDDKGKEHEIPQGCAVVYREYYGANPDGSGVRLANEEIARGIINASGDDEITRWVADPSIFKEDGGPSIAEQFRRAGVSFQPGDNTRLSGWSQIRMRLQPNPPMLRIFTTCRNLISILPSLQHDLKRPEDLDTTGPDHIADALRYGLMARPFAQPYKSGQEVVRLSKMRMSQVLAKTRKK